VLTDFFANLDSRASSSAQEAEAQWEEAFTLQHDLHAEANNGSLRLRDLAAPLRECSGRGRCRLLRELPSVAAARAAGAFSTDWGLDHVQACICDPGFTGPDCSQRLCPLGDDPETAPMLSLPLSFAG